MNFKQADKIIITSDFPKTLSIIYLFFLSSVLYPLLPLMLDSPQFSIFPISWKLCAPVSLPRFSSPPNPHFEKQ